MFWIVKLPTSYLLIQVLVVHSSEWELTTEHSKEKNSTGPDISRWSIVLFFAHYFWTHVRGCTTENLEFDVSTRAAAEPEVNQLNNTPFVDNDVLKLDVSVCHIPLVEVVQDTQ